MPGFAAAFLMSVIVGVRYLMISGALAAWTRAAGRGHPVPKAQIRAEIRWSLLSALIYGLPAGLTYWAWNRQGLTALYWDPRGQPLWWLAAAPLLYLFAHDTWFYWTHRLMHRPWWFRHAHAVHHASRPPTAWAAMSFHPLGSAFGRVALPRARVGRPYPCRHARSRPSRRLGHGHYQPHGLGHAARAHRARAHRGCGHLGRAP